MNQVPLYSRVKRITCPGENSSITNSIGFIGALLVLLVIFGVDIGNFAGLVDLLVVNICVDIGTIDQ